MSILYNCHTDGDNYRITKFNDGEVESSYLCSTTECQCPAGSRPICRHRLMLPMFLDRGAVDTFWFLDFERKGWVSNDPADAASWREPSVSDVIGPNPILDDLVLCERSEFGSSNLEPAYGIGPMITNAIPLIEADNERTRLRNVENEAQSRPSWRRV